MPFLLGYTKAMRPRHISMCGHGEVERTAAMVWRQGGGGPLLLLFKLCVASGDSNRQPMWQCGIFLSKHQT